MTRAEEIYNEEKDAKEMVKETKNVYNYYINEHVDYEVLVNIQVYADGTRFCEVEDELLTIYDAAGDVRDQFNVTLPSKYALESLERAQEDDV